MPQENRGGPSKGGKTGGERRDGRPGGNNRGGPKRSGPNRGGPVPERIRAETYELVKEVTRGADFKIEKSVVADKATHKPVRTEYRLTRQGLDGTQLFSRLADAITASTAPLPEPNPEPVAETASAAEPDETDTATPEPEAAAETVPEPGEVEHQ